MSDGSPKGAIHEQSTVYHKAKHGAAGGSAASWCHLVRKRLVCSIHDFKRRCVHGPRVWYSSCCSPLPYSVPPPSALEMRQKPRRLAQRCKEDLSSLLRFSVKPVSNRSQYGTPSASFPTPWNPPADSSFCVSCKGSCIHRAPVTATPSVFEQTGVRVHPMLFQHTQRSRC